MGNPTNHPNSGNAGAGRTQPTTNAPANTGKQDAPKSNTTQERTNREGGDAPRNEQGNRSNPNASTPRYDDRPEPKKNEQAGAGNAPKSGNSTGNPGTPNYGDTEPNDPRKLDVDAGTGARNQSGERANRS